MNLIEYADREMMALDVANILTGALENSLFHTERASLAVPGGSTPGPIFDSLAAVDLHWSRIDVLATDERFVPDGDVRSNARLIRERLLTDRAASANLLSYHSALSDPEAAAAAQQEDVAAMLPISVLLLGMGADMHVASLFPGASGLEKALAPDAPPLVALYPDSQPEARLSLSAATLNGALSKHLVITGIDKRDALENAVSLSPKEAPVKAILTDLSIHWAP